MPSQPPHDRLLPGAYEPALRPVEPGDSAGVVSFRQAVAVVRRRMQLILAITAVGAALGLFLASRDPTTYRASAMLRMAGERQNITGDEGDVSPNIRSADPMLSIIELLRSRAVAGVVVDSLGLQVVSLTPEFSVEDLDQVKVDPRAAGDSVLVAFREDGVSARRGERAVTATYGQLVNLGVVQFIARSRPATETVTLGIRSRESAIDALLVGLLVTRREMTDVIDVAFVAEDPRTAQKVVNSTVQAFQMLNVQWARERSRRKSEFLAEQLAKNDSLLELAQAGLSSFRSRQQLASSRDKLAADQAALLQLDGQRAQLDADRQTFGVAARAAQVEGRGLARRGAPGAGHVPGDGRQPEHRRALPAAAQVPAPHRLDDDRPLACLGHNPDLIQLRALTRSTQDQLVQAVSSHMGDDRCPKSSRSAPCGPRAARPCRSSPPWPRRRCG